MHIKYIRSLLLISFAVIYIYALKFHWYTSSFCLSQFLTFTVSLSLYLSHSLSLTLIVSLSLSLTLTLSLLFISLISLINEYNATMRLTSVSCFGVSFTSLSVIL